MRPIQRFAELSNAFRSEIEVNIEDRRASGKSVMGLMSLRGKHGSLMKITATGEDGCQAVGILGFLVSEDFFVEDALASVPDPNRHLTRLVKMASCFDSRVMVELDGRKADGRHYEELLQLGLTPTSKVEFHVDGDDSAQAARVLRLLAERCFYVEEEMSAQA